MSARCRRCIIPNYGTNSGGSTLQWRPRGDLLPFGSSSSLENNRGEIYSRRQPARKERVISDRGSPRLRPDVEASRFRRRLWPWRLPPLSAAIIPACWCFQLLWQPRFFISNRHPSYMYRAIFYKVYAMFSVDSFFESRSRCMEIVVSTLRCVKNGIIFKALNDTYVWNAQKLKKGILKVLFCILRIYSCFSRWIEIVKIKICWIKNNG